MKSIKLFLIAFLMIGMVAVGVNSASANETDDENIHVIDNSDKDEIPNNETEVGNEENIDEEILVEEQNDIPQEKEAVAMPRAAVPLPAPINQAFPQANIASAIALAVYSNASLVNNNVSQAQLNAIKTINISGFNGGIDLNILTAYGGFSNLELLTVNGSGIVVFPANFNATQFPAIKTLNFTTIGNTSLPDFQLPSLNYLNGNNLNNLVAIPNFTGLGALTNLYFNYGANLTTVPDFTNLPNLTSLTLTSLSILASIPDFQHIPKLRVLNTQYSPLAQAINFSNLPNLVSLSHSSKGAIPDYDNLPELTSMSLMSGDYNTIPDFSHIPKLTYSYLWTSSPTLIIPDFSNLPEMKTMTIRGLNTGVTTTPTNTVPDFSHMPEMNSFTITGLAITSAPDFSHMPILTALAINNTKLLNVPDFSHIPLLKTLSVSENNLTSVPDFQNIPVLNQLTISSTLITSVPNFSNMNVLTTMYLNNNKLTSLPNFNMPNLATLYAATNAIASIGTFENVRNLKSLTLSTNNLTTIPNWDLPLLTTLALDNNRIETLPLLDKVPAMTSFNVSKNRVKELPQRVLNFAVGNLTPQYIAIPISINTGSNITTDLPIVDQIIAKVPGFGMRTSTIDGSPVSVGPIGSVMTIPTSTLAQGTHSAYLSMGPTSNVSMVAVSYSIIVSDIAPPVISSDDEITYEAGSPLPTETEFLTAIHASAIDGNGQSIEVHADLDELDMDVPNDYEVIISAEDGEGNETTKTIRVLIEDTTEPVITADEEIIYEAGTPLPTNEQFLAAINASATDLIDGEVDIDVDLSSLNMNLVGTYQIEISAEDNSGNRATKTINVLIVDTTPPLITANSEVSFKVGSELPSEDAFLLAIQASAVDIVDGDVEISVDLSTINMNVVGIYYVTISAEDSAGNESQKIITVHILANDKKPNPQDNNKDDKTTNKDDTSIETSDATNTSNFILMIFISIIAISYAMIKKMKR